MLAHAWKHLLTVWLGRVHSSSLILRPRWWSPTSPRRCWSLHMQLPSVPLPLATLLLRADSLPHCTSPPCKKRHKYWHWQNIGARQDFTDFRQTIAVTISAHRRPIKNWWKQKVVTITVQYQFLYSRPSKQRPSQRSTAEGSVHSKGTGPRGGGGRKERGRGHANFLIKVNWRGGGEGVSKQPSICLLSWFPPPLTLSLLVSLSPISRLLWDPLSINAGLRWSE